MDREFYRRRLQRLKSMPIRKQKMAIELYLIMSKQPQSGKTTWCINEMLTNIGKADHILFTYDRVGIQHDAIEKLHVAAEKRGIEVTNLITSAKDLRKAYSKRLKGDLTPIMAVLLGNINSFKAAKLLLSMKETLKVPQWLYFDEIHRYTFGEKLEDVAQIDNFINEVYDNNQCQRMYCISATAHDMLYSPLPITKTVVLNTYPGFKGLRDAQWVTRPPEFFTNVVQAWKDDKPVPSEFIDLFDIYAWKDMIINLHPQTSFHEYMAGALISTGQYNMNKKEIMKSIVGRGSIGVSTTVPHNKIMYNINLKSNSTSIGNIVQAIGRVNGTKLPVVITTPEIKEAVFEYMDLNDKIINEKVYEMPVEDRQNWLSEQTLRYAKILSGNKHKKARHIETTTGYKKGNPDNCGEVYKEFYIPHIACKEWTGKGPGQEVKKWLEENDPIFFNKIKNLKMMTDTDTRREIEGDLFTRNRNAKDYMVRIGKCTGERIGYVAVVVVEDPSLPDFFDRDGNLWSPIKEETGCVHHIDNKPEILTT